MNKAMLIPMFLLIAVARAEAVEPVRPFTPEGERSTRAIWLQPLVHGSLMLVSPLMGGPLHVAIPLGADLPLSERTGLVIELTPMYTRVRCDAGGPRCGSVRAFRASTGVAWTPWPGARGDGFFLQPKLGGMWSYEEDRAEGASVARANRRTRGGQLTWNQRRKEVDLGAPYGMPWGDARRDGRIFDINMDLLRVGFSF